MNKATYKTIIIFSTFLLFGIIGNNLDAQNIDSLARKEIQDLQIIDSLALNEIQNLKISAENTKNLSQIADSIISWTGIIFTIFAVILLVTSFYTGIQIREIRKTKKEVKRILADAKKVLKKQSRAIENLKKEFEKEKDLHLKLMFPLIEGELSFQQGDIRKALYHYNEAKEISPNHPSLKKFSWLLINTGKFKEAIQNLEAQLKIIPDDKEAIYYLAHAYRRNNQIDIAEQLIKPIATKSKYPRALYEYASILLRKKDFENAERMFIEANHYYPINDWFCYLSLSFTQVILNKQKNAVKNAKKAKQIIKKELLKTPTSAHLILQLGLVKLIRNEKDGAETVKLSISKEPPIENAKSAFEKLELLETISPSTQISHAIELLKKYCKNEKDI